MKFVFSAPSSDNLIRLLKAWRFWLLGAVAGALIGAAVYLVAPPQYRARATVNVDFHMEQAWPQNTDREQFYYLERETRKLEEIAMSDAVLSAAAAQSGGGNVEELRGEKLQLSQPGNGGWHFFVDDRDPHKAAAIAGAWAQAFAQQVQSQVAQPSSGLEKYISAAPTQAEGLQSHRSVSMSLYMLAGAMVVLALATIGILFVDRQA
jgi:capsular polysaccharide biosynthesis protein